MDMSDRLMKLRPLYIREARKCARGNAYFGAAVMHLAAFEAALQSICLIYWDEVKKTSVYAKQLKRGFRRKRNKALDLNLTQLINIADELGWFPPQKMHWIGKRKTLAGFSLLVRDIRNRVHPAVWARLMRSDPIKFNRKTLRHVIEVCDTADSWLLHRVEKGLLKAMEKEHWQSPSKKKR